MNHCEKCWEAGAKKKDLHGPYFCTNPACECHTAKVSQEKEIDKKDLLSALVRDFTAVGYMSKSEARRRFEEIRAADRAALVRAVEVIKEKYETSSSCKNALEEVLALLHSPEKK